MIQYIRKLIFILIFFMFSIGVIFFIFFEVYYQVTKTNPIYNDFLVNIKREEYIKAHKIIYPLVLEMDKEALNLISDTYYYGLGVRADIVKANIWKERSQCQCLDTGFTEYKKYDDYLKKGNSEFASVLLQEAAKKGSREAISILKNDEYIKKNRLAIEPNWKKYWIDFDYDNLYPFCQKIEECKNNLIIN